MNMNPSNQAPTRIVEFCTLEYRPSKAGILSGAPGRLIATVCRDLSNSLTIRVEPEWQRFVNLEDAQDVEEFLADLSIRSVEDPTSLWAQLIQINWGLVVTGELYRTALVQGPVESQTAAKKPITSSPQTTH